MTRKFAPFIENGIYTPICRAEDLHRLAIIIPAVSTMHSDPRILTDENQKGKVNLKSNSSLTEKSLPSRIFRASNNKMFFSFTSTFILSGSDACKTASPVWYLCNSTNDSF